MTAFIFHMYDNNDHFVSTDMYVFLSCVGKHEDIRQMPHTILVVIEQKPNYEHSHSVQPDNHFHNGHGYDSRTLPVVHGRSP